MELIKLWLYNRKSHLYLTPALRKKRKEKNVNLHGMQRLILFLKRLRKFSSLRKLF